MAYYKGIIINLFAFVIFTIGEFYEIMFLRLIGFGLLVPVSAAAYDSFNEYIKNKSRRKNK